MRFQTRIIAAAFSGLLVLFITYQVRVTNSSQTPLRFPFEVVDESRNSMGEGMWSVRVILRKRDYSRDNLDSLFRFFSKQYQEGDRLQITLYTDQKMLEREGTDQLDFATLANPRSASSLSDGPNYDAAFYRQGDGAASADGINEFYNYLPDLKQRRVRKSIVIRGTHPFATRRVLETTDASGGGHAARIISYELIGAEPVGRYYTMEILEQGSLYWRKVLSVRSDEVAVPPNSRIIAVDRHVAYAFLGWMYAVTTDGGRSWSVWDAERHLQNWRRNELGAISGVILKPDGTGTMKLADSAGGPNELHLQTTNFGKDWVMK